MHCSLKFTKLSACNAQDQRKDLKLITHSYEYAIASLVFVSMYAIRFMQHVCVSAFFFHRNADECISPNTAANFFSTHIILLFTRKTVQSKLVLTNEKKIYNNLKFPLNLFPILVHTTCLLSSLLLLLYVSSISFSPLSTILASSVIFTINYSPDTHACVQIQANVFTFFVLRICRRFINLQIFAHLNRVQSLFGI